MAEIDGVDLSPKMLEQASCKQIYSKLDCDEIVAWLERTAAESLAFDIVLSADVFIYVGNLEPAFKATRRILADNGLFVFSVEHLAQGSFEVRPTGRYGAYVHLTCASWRPGTDSVIEPLEQVKLTSKRANVMIGGTDLCADTAVTLARRPAT